MSRPRLYVSLRELSRAMSLSSRTLRQLIRDPVRPLPAYRVGGKYLICLGEIQEWVTAHRVETPDIDAIAADVLTVPEEPSDEEE